MRLLALFVAMGLVTYLPRALPLLHLHQRGLPFFLLRVLEGIPVAVLAAFVAPLVLGPKGSVDISLRNQHLLVALPTTLVALWSRSLIVTVVAGSGAMMVLRALT